jgi:hypothetical protein
MSQWLVVNAYHFLAATTILIGAFALYNVFTVMRQKRGETVRSTPYILAGALLVLCAMCFFLGVIATH